MLLPSMDQLYCLLTIKCLFLGAMIWFEVALNDENQFDLCKTRFSTSKLHFNENKPHRLQCTLSRSSSQTPLFCVGSKAVMGPSPQSNNSQAQQGQGYTSIASLRRRPLSNLPFLYTMLSSKVTWNSVYSSGVIHRTVIDYCCSKIRLGHGQTTLPPFRNVCHPQ